MADHDQPLIPSAAAPADRDVARRTDDRPNPWTRVLGILAIGSIAAAGKAASGGRTIGRSLDAPSDEVVA